MNRTGGLEWICVVQAGEEWRVKLNILGFLQRGNLLGS